MSNSRLERWMQLVEFTRPHTIIGTSLAVIVFYLHAAAATGRHDVGLLLSTWAAGLCVNVYVVGINQITDVDIDRINKPYLPLASGAFSMRTGMAITAATGVSCLAIAAAVGPWLIATIGTVFVIGTAYSVPPLRLKRFPFAAAASITIARAVVFHLGVYLSYASALGGEAVIPTSVVAFVCFMLLFVIVISVMKDVPDMEGDRRNQISTFVLSLGATKVMGGCRALLTTAYVSMIVAAAAGLAGVHAPTAVATHTVALATVWGMSVGCDDENAAHATRYYIHCVWKLFYFEFVTFTAAVMLASHPHSGM